MLSQDYIKRAHEVHDVIFLIQSKFLSPCFEDIMGLKVVILTVKYASSEDRYYLIRNDRGDSILLEQTLSDTDEESIGVVTNAELEDALDSGDRKRIESVLRIDYPDEIEIKLEILEDAKASLIVQRLAMEPELKDLLKVFLIEDVKH